MAEASPACGERKTDKKADNLCLNGQKCCDERKTNEQTSEHQDTDSCNGALNASNVLHVPSATNPRQNKASGAIPKVRYSQPLDIPSLEDDGNSVHVSPSVAEFTMLATTTTPVTALECADYPSWSLPPPPNNVRNNITSSANQGDLTYSKGSSSVDESLLSLKREARETVLASAGSEASERLIFEETSESVSNLDDSVQPMERPPTPEKDGHSPHNSPVPFVTGHWCLKTSVACEVHQNQNVFIQQSGSPTENDDHTTNEGLLQQYEKANQIFHLNETFLVEELREKCKQCMDLQAENDKLKQLLEESRAESDNLRREKEEVIQERELLSHQFNESVVLLAGNNEMVRQLQELYITKSEECERLKEGCGPHQPPPFLDGDED